MLDFLTFDLVSVSEEGIEVGLPTSGQRRKNLSRGM